MHHERQVADAMARDGTKPILTLHETRSDLPTAIPRVIGS
jgi:hypothetical protein